ncbi:MAG: tRNA threonylcarbamoyladenosine dehydratase [Bacteroidetes bacterium ADurb.BinA174]|nr:MAG: tRNA threonylcarbamoyladenosine dehydratase [Bacteroidetes bacterium ADurb.BinA174]
MEYSFIELFARTQLLIGPDAMEALMSKKVILFGVGGVGSWCAEGLVRSGITQLTIVDADCVAPSNINRQLPATTTTVGQLKVDVLKKRLQEINPEAQITAIAEIYSEESSESFHLEQYDYIIDAIDTLQHKAHLLVAASKTSATVFSSMGAALKIDSQQIKVAEFWKVKGCRLAAALRQRFRKGEKPHKKIMCVYSEEIQENKGKQISRENALEDAIFDKPTVNGTLVHITAIFGFTLSGLVIRDIGEQTFLSV